MAERRRWFQIHLSTAIVLMFVAGGLMWANTIQCELGSAFQKRQVHGFPFHWANAEWAAANVFVCSGLLVAAGVAYEAFSRGRWPMSLSVFFFGSALVVPLGLFLSRFALPYVQFQSEKLIAQGWPWPVVYWQWDDESKHWIDFPSPITALGDFGAVMLLVAGGVLASSAIVRVIEKLGHLAARDR